MNFIVARSLSFLQRTLSLLKGATGYAISDKNKSSLKGKWWPLVLLFAMNLTSSLKAYNSDKIKSSLKMRYIYHTSTPFFFSHQTFIPSQLILKLSLTLSQALPHGVASHHRSRLSSTAPTQASTVDADPNPRH